MTSIIALIELNLTLQLRTRRWLYAVIAFIVVMLLGWRRSHDTFYAFTDGVMLGAMIALNFGIAYDRRTGFDHLLTHFASGRMLLFSKMAAAAILTTAYLLFAFLSSWGLSFDIRLSLWHTLHSFLFLWLTIPVVLLIEAVVDITVPAAIGVLAFGLAIAFVIMHAQSGGSIASMIGLRPRVGIFGDLLRLVLFNLVWSAAVGGVAAAAWSFRRRALHISFRA